MLTIGEAAYGANGNSLCYFHNFPVNLKLFKNKNTFKKSVNICTPFSGSQLPRSKSQIPLLRVLAPVDSHRGLCHWHHGTRGIWGCEKREEEKASVPVLPLCSQQLASLSLEPQPEAASGALSVPADAHFLASGCTAFRFRDPGGNAMANSPPVWWFRFSSSLLCLLQLTSQSP